MRNNRKKVERHDAGHALPDGLLCHRAVPAPVEALTSLHLPTNSCSPTVLNAAALPVARSGGFYARNDGKNWIGTMLATATLFPTACFGIAAALNTVAIAYHSLAAVPFGSIMVVLLIWMFISFPLCLLGTVRGRAARPTPILS